MMLFLIYFSMLYHALAGASAAPPIAKAQLACAHILSRRQVPRFRHLIKPSKSHSTTLKPSSFERFHRYLLNTVNRVWKFDF